MAATHSLPLFAHIIMLAKVAIRKDCIRNSQANPEINHIIGSLPLRCSPLLFCQEQTPRSHAPVSIAMHQRNVMSLRYARKTVKERRPNSCVVCVVESVQMSSVELLLEASKLPLLSSLLLEHECKPSRDSN